ncbi:hypothetical protein Taro_023982 [Colocasia esculenta]|uniref:Cytochrome P450 n=1 Tax=Colocasia esculenta TaxID=4460 RepID=A0A843VCE2_COLES|nr:hypothetical protein [Colocasia esculenta]
MAGRREAAMRLWRQAGEESGSDGGRGSWMGGVLFHHAPKSLHLPVAWVAKEALRLHPPTPLMLPHRANADVKLAGYDVAKGSNVLVNVWAITRNPTVWKDPLEFRPERFADEDVDMKGHDFRLLPFGARRRVKKDPRRRAPENEEREEAVAPALSSEAKEEAALQGESAG